MILALFSWPLQVQAAVMVPGSNPCAEAITSDDPPSIARIFCPLIKVINFLVFSASLVFGIMLGYGGIKMSLALGDPKGFEGAKMTMTYAVMGLAVVLGFFVILNIASAMFGYNLVSPDNITNTFFGNMNALLEMIGITED